MSGPWVHERPQRLTLEELSISKKEFNYMVKQGIWTPSMGPWAAPLQLLKKKTNDEWRLCGDYSLLNSVTIEDKYTVPHIHDFGHMLEGKTYFST